MFNLYRYNLKGNIITNLVVILVLLIAILIPNTTQAVSVGVNYTDSWEYEKRIEGGSCSDFEAETDFTMSLSKNFDLNVARIGNLRTSETRVIRPGEGVVGVNYNVTGSYNYSSGDKRTPPMDNQIYPWNYISQPGWCDVRFEVRNQMRGGISKQLSYTLSSSDNSIIDCSAGTYCTSKDKDGTATITVSFPGKGSYYVERNYEWGETRQIYSYTTPTSTNSCRGRSCATTYSCPSGYTLTRQGRPNQGRGYSDTCKSNTPTPTWFKKDSKYAYKSFDYTLNSIYYNVRVEIPNKPPTVDKLKVSDISYTKAKLNWDYSDPEGDVQKSSRVQVSTDNMFNNIVFTRQQDSADESMDISRLRPNTTYYTRLKVRNDKNGWYPSKEHTDDNSWVKGPSFKTLDNPLPDLNEFSCRLENLPNNNINKYTGAKVSWEYTGDDPDTLKLRIKYTQIDSGSVNIVPGVFSTKIGNRGINDLVSGYKYKAEIQVLDEYNNYPADIYTNNQWKDCGTVTPPNYPVPNVEFSLSSGDKTVQKGGTLTIKTGDSVKTSWNITDSVGVKENSCRLITTRILGDLDADIFEKGINRGFTGNNLLGKNLPVSLTDQKYKIELKCDGKDAKTKRDILESITLVLESYPVVSCSIVNGQRSVSSDNSSINLNIDVSNVDQYVWELKRDINDNWSTGPSSSPIPNPITLNYTGTAFGRYRPWIKVTKSGTDRFDEATCGTITNLGDSNIREVNP